LRAIMGLGYKCRELKKHLGYKVEEVVPRVKERAKPKAKKPEEKDVGLVVAGPNIQNAEGELELPSVGTGSRPTGKELFSKAVRKIGSISKMMKSEEKRSSLPTLAVVGKDSPPDSPTGVRGDDADLSLPPTRGSARRRFSGSRGRQPGEAADPDPMRETASTMFPGDDSDDGYSNMGIDTPDRPTTVDSRSRMSRGVRHTMPAGGAPSMRPMTTPIMEVSASGRQDLRNRTSPRTPPTNERAKTTKQLPRKGSSGPLDRASPSGSLAYPAPEVRSVASNKAPKLPVLQEKTESFEVAKALGATSMGAGEPLVLGLPRRGPGT